MGDVGSQDICPHGLSYPGLFPHTAKVKGHEVTDSVPVTRGVASRRLETRNENFPTFPGLVVGAVRLREVPKGHEVRGPRFPCERAADASPADVRAVARMMGTTL